MSGEPWLFDSWIRNHRARGANPTRVIPGHCARLRAHEPQPLQLEWRGIPTCSAQNRSRFRARSRRLRRRTRPGM